MKRLIILLILCWAAVPARAEMPVILVLGDSISAGYGLSSPAEGWAALLQAKLREQGYGYEVVNASVSGETTAGGLARLPRALDLHHPSIVILELGGNDGLRALATAQMLANLERMVDIATAAGAKVLLLGMRIPPNYGPEYTAQFAAVYSNLAREKQLPLVPFLLKGIALSLDRMQPDGIHPNQSGQALLLDNVWPELAPLLRQRPHFRPFGPP